MAKKMLINVIESEECRVAILEDSQLEELYIERISRGQVVGNIYKGRVVNTEPSIEAAFVDIGLKKNGFLHVSEVASPEVKEDVEGFRAQKEHRRIQALLKPGQEILAQVIKEGVGEKGPSLTNYLSLPGRYLVLMPQLRRHGVSRKIADEEERRRLKHVIEELTPPPDTGIIVRTAGAGQTKKELSKDLHYLLRLWKVVEERSKTAPIPSIIYQESDLVTRTIRDIFSADIEEIIVDSESACEKARDFLRQIMPKCEKRVQLYRRGEPLFHKFKIEQEIDKINEKKIALPRGGSIVIEQTEALVAIDVNSGKFRAGADPEETAFKTNLEAAKEIARQIRLRDLGGVIIIDFIDMREENHNRTIEKTVWEVLKKDRARTKMLRMSKFGIIEITRQRIRPSLRDVLFESCPYCAGVGSVKTVESLSLAVLRQIKSAMNSAEVKTIEVEADQKVAHYLQNQKRRQIAEAEESYNKRVIINTLASADGQRPDNIRVKYYNPEGQPVNL